MSGETGAPVARPCQLYGGAHESRLGAFERTVGISTLWVCSECAAMLDRAEAASQPLDSMKRPDCERCGSTTDVRDVRNGTRVPSRLCAKCIDSADIEVRRDLREIGFQNVGYSLSSSLARIAHAQERIAEAAEAVRALLERVEKRNDRESAPQPARGPQRPLKP